MTAATEVVLSKIGQIALTVGDIDRAVKYYRDVLGMRFLFTAPPKLAFFDCAGIRLMLSEPEKGGVGASNSVIYYKVDDINATHELLDKRGVRFLTKPHMVAKLPDHDLWLADFHDPDANVLCLMSEVSREVMA